MLGAISTNPQAAPGRVCWEMIMISGQVKQKMRLLLTYSGGGNWVLGVYILQSLCFKNTKAPTSTRRRAPLTTMAVEKLDELLLFFRDSCVTDMRVNQRAKVVVKERDDSLFTPALLT